LNSNSARGLHSPHNVTSRSQRRLAGPRKPVTSPASGAALTSFGVRDFQLWRANRIGASVVTQAQTMRRAASRLAAFTRRCRSRRKLFRAGYQRVRSSESHGILFCSLACLGLESATRARVCFHGRRARISRTVAQCHQRIQRRLTRHSRGGPTACHQARATERVRPFSVARAWRPTVGLPLSSNVRRHRAWVHLFLEQDLSLGQMCCSLFLVGALRAGARSRLQGKAFPWPAKPKTCSIRSSRSAPRLPAVKASVLARVKSKSLALYFSVSGRKLRPSTQSYPPAVLLAVPPNRSLKWEGQRRATRPRPAVRCTFLPSGAWRHTVVLPLSSNVRPRRLPPRTSSIAGACQPP
jgi:hypothetical protein